MHQDVCLHGGARSNIVSASMRLTRKAREWYVSVGQALAGVVLPACITPNVMLMMQYPIAIVQRYFLAGCVFYVHSAVALDAHNFF